MLPFHFELVQYYKLLIFIEYLTIIIIYNIIIYKQLILNILIENSHKIICYETAIKKECNLIFMKDENVYICKTIKMLPHSVHS